MTTDYIKTMIELSSEKRKKLEGLLEFSKIQGRLIKEDNIEEVNTILQKKEEIMLEIDNIDKDFLYAYEKVKEEEGIDGIDMINIQKYDNLKTLKLRVNEINSILDEITKLDQENMLNMESSIKKIKSDLKQVKEVKRAYKGYNYESVESILIDEKK